MHRPHLQLPSSSCPHPLHTSSGIQLQGGWKITALKPAKLCKMCQGNHPKACRVSLDVFIFFEYLNPEIEWVICRIYNTSHTRFEVQVGLPRMFRRSNMSDRSSHGRSFASSSDTFEYSQLEYPLDFLIYTVYMYNII